MRRIFPAAVFAASLAAVTLHAQIPNGATSPPVTPVPKPTDVTPHPTTAPKPPGPFTSGATGSGASDAAKPTSEAAKSDHITVSGCIERADQVASSAGRDPDSLQFVLVRPLPEQSNSSAAPASKAAPGDSRVMFRLSGDQQKMNPHVGHKVEIVGTPSVMAATATTGTASAESGGPSSGAPGLTVESVRMIDATCSNK